MDRPVGRILYTTVLDHDGGCVCDLTVTRLGDDRYLLVTGGGSGPRDVAWLRSQLPEGGARAAARRVLVARRARALGAARARACSRGSAPDDLSLPVHAARARSGSARCRRWRCASRTPASWAGSCTRRPSTAASSGTSSSRPAPSSASCRRHGRVQLAAHGEGLSLRRRRHDARVHAGRGRARLHRALHEAALHRPRGRAAARARGPRKRCAASCWTTSTPPARRRAARSRDGHAVGYVTSADFGYTVGRHVLLGWLPPELAPRARRSTSTSSASTTARPSRTSRSTTPRASGCASDEPACTEAARVRKSHAHSFPPGSSTRRADE